MFHPEHYSLAKSVPVNPSTNDVGFDSLEDHHVPRAAARCGGCDEPVQPTMSVHRDGEIWHVACLKTFEVSCGSRRALHFSADSSHILVRGHIGNFWDIFLGRSLLSVIMANAWNRSERLYLGILQHLASLTDIITIPVSDRGFIDSRLCFIL